MSFNLYSVLTEKDKIILNNYITTYGINEKNFIGLEKWLSSWGTDKIKLYKLLGENLFYKIPYTYEEPFRSIEDKFDDLIYSRKYNNFFSDVRDLLHIDVPKTIYSELYHAIAWARVYAENKVSKEVILDFKKDKKKVVISNGMKPIKALLKFLQYMDIYEENKDIYEEFRLDHSRIFNEKIIKGNLVISIHPMDFITMSDNASSWSSCMSWTCGNGEGGCYKIGSTEMLFSNCVVCCYLEGSTPYCFKKDESDKELYSWNNKKWRQLFYITKDIIVGGKAYPYKSEELSNKLLLLLKNLAKENLNYKYAFGPEEYMDMKGVYEEYDFDKAREDNGNRHRILFETRGMYNDMVNDHSIHPACFRNKVNRNKIINISGKSKCLCCLNEVVDYNEYPDEYNERFENTGSLICSLCLDEKFTCEECDWRSPKGKFYIVEGRKVCENCFNKYKKCPCGCGTVLNLNSYMTHGPEAKTNVFTYIYSDKYSKVSQRRSLISGISHNSKEMIEEYNFAPLFMCEKELKKQIKNEELVRTSKIIKFTEENTFFPLYLLGGKEEDYYITKKSYDDLLKDENLKKFLYENLENAYIMEE